MSNSERSRLANASYSAHSRSVISLTAVRLSRPRPSRSTNSASMSRVDSPRAYISTASASGSSVRRRTSSRIRRDPQHAHSPDGVDGLRSRHRSATTWSSVNATTRGAVRHADYHHRFESCQTLVPGSRRRRKWGRLWRSGVIYYFRALEPCLAIEACATAYHWTRELTCARGYGKADAAGLREGLCQALQERRCRCGSDLRGRRAAINAVRTGKGH